ncbi:transcription termination factor Rho [Corynebacterium sp. 35RC1]|nr:transcription termination factor Rho [Corynebacterium sp. 35RC1]
MSDSDNGAQRNLAALRLPELRKIAAELGLKGTSGLRKGELIAAITGAQGGSGQASAQTSKPRRATKASAAAQASEEQRAPEHTAAVDNGEQAQAEQEPRGRRRRATRSAAPQEQPQATDATSADTAQAARAESGAEPGSDNSSDNSGDNSGDNGSEEVRYESRSAARRARRNRARREQRGQRDTAAPQDNAKDHADSDASKDAGNGERAQGEQQDEGNTAQNNRRSDRNDRSDRSDRNDRNGRRNRRNRRGRDRDGENNEVREDDVLQQVAGILDIVDNNVAFVRTSGYHPGPADVYVNNQMIRRLGLRAGDAIVGQVRLGHEQTAGRGRNRQKYNPLVRVDSVNGMTVEEAKGRPDFSKLTPLYPNQRLRLETDPKILTTRVIDLIMPIGKGQRALIVSPPKAGKTTILQNIANAIATNNPECYLMVVLVDERPEEVTDMQRSVKGEVIASTFDRPPSEHTAVAELAIERAKRLVEQGQDVVVLLDSITRLGRAYNNSSPASGRILSGGVDSNALYPPKRFLGAARNIENGGSLTIIATAMVETGSAGDTVIFEEFKGTGNAELKLDRKISERRVFPAVDVNPSGTRKDELLLAPEEARIMHKLRRILSALDNQQAIDLLIKQLKKTKNNGEFLMQVASSAPMAADAEEE